MNILGNWKCRGILCILGIFLPGCHAQEAAVEGEAAAPANVGEEDRLAKVRGFVEKNSENFSNYAMKFAKSDDLKKALRDLFEEAPDLVLLDKRGLEAFYRARGYAPIFVVSGRLSPKVSVLEEEFLNLGRHGLEIDISAWKAARAEGTGAGEGHFAFTGRELDLLAQMIVRGGVDIRDGRAVGKLIASQLGENSEIPRLREHVEALAARQRRGVQGAARLEVLTADLAMRFAQAMAFENLTHMTSEELTYLGARPKAERYREVVRRRTLGWLSDVARVLDAAWRDDAVEAVESGALAESGTAVWEAKTLAQRAQVAAAEDRARRFREASELGQLVALLYPAHPDYRQLMRAQEKYASMPDWPVKISGGLRLKVGRSHRVVPQLRKRLAAEGYDGGMAHVAPGKEAVYDRALHEAVVAYHESHQLSYDPEKGLEKSFWSSLNVPRKERLRQIEENLRRWHHAQLVESANYVWINVPEFYGEVWRNGVRVHRFAVVVGNAKRACDPETKRWFYINATPLMHARMQYLEYNPYWIVPRRIEQEDYIEKINADPGWLSAHGFEYYTEGGHTVLRQLPSERNALGRVKFIFPNPHSTFLHDSPQKGLFRYPIRAFSHGCMRVWEPLELARILLENDGQWYDGLMTEIEDLNPRRIVFKHALDVFIDYFTVRAHGDGRVEFFADPYRYVKDGLNPPSEKSQECEATPRAWIARAAGGGDDVGVDVSDND